MKNVQTRFVVALVVMVLSSAVWSQAVLADEISVTENGSGSHTDATSEHATTSTVSSQNTTTVTNDIQLTADTGSNTVSANAQGTTGVQTGDISAQAALENTANATQIQPACCSAKGTMTIVSGNGTNSKNTAGNSSQTTTQLSVQQVANVTNSVTGSASTGGNKANDNTGNVTIKTGAVKVQVQALSGPLNSTQAKLPSPTGQTTGAVIRGNGNDSQNTVTNTENTITSVVIENVVAVINNVVAYLNTGKNEANNNEGDVLIETGNIDFEATIESGPINSTTMTVDCHCGEKPHEQPVPVPPLEKITPQQPTSSDGSSGFTGEVASITAGKVLPVTGVNWLVLAFVGNVMMLFLGMILRLRSGNAPGIIS